MEKKPCPEGKKWDNLVNVCMPSKSLREPPLTVANPLKAINTTAKPNSMVLLSPALWMFVVLVVVGSILALTVWFIICKRQTRHSSSTCEDGMPRQELLQKAEPPAKLHPLPSERNGQAEIFQREAEAPSPCSHVHLGSQMGSEWEERFTACGDLMMRTGTEGGRGLPVCSTMVEHRIPLPATELGGTALVTTKTM